MRTISARSDWRHADKPVAALSRQELWAYLQGLRAGGRILEALEKQRAWQAARRARGR